jgi:hypothetical protein
MAGTHPNSRPVSSGHAQREEQDAAVRVARDARDRNARGHQPQHQRARPCRDQYSDGATAQSQQHAFRQQMADQPTAARAERHTDRKLFTTRRGAAEQQVGDVRAGDQQNQSDHAHQEI